MPVWAAAGGHWHSQAPSGKLQQLCPCSLLPVLACWVPSPASSTLPELCTPIGCPPEPHCFASPWGAQGSSCTFLPCGALQAARWQAEVCWDAATPAYTPASSRAAIFSRAGVAEPLQTLLELSLSPVSQTRATSPGHCVANERALEWEGSYAANDPLFVFLLCPSPHPTSPTQLQPHLPPGPKSGTALR